MVQRKKNIVLLWVVGVVLSIAMVLPFLIMILTALKPTDEVLSGRILLSRVDFSTFGKALSRGNWPLYFFNSFRLTVVVVGVSVIINSLAGYAFARLRFRFRDVLFIVSLIGLMIPPQTKMIPTFIVLRHVPFMGGNDIFGDGGIGLYNSFLGLMAPLIAGSFGVFMYRQFFLNYPQALEDAACIDGLSKFQIYLRVFMPLSGPVTASLVVLKTTATWNEYLWPLILTTGENLRTVQLALQVFKDEDIIEWNLLMAATLTVMLPLVILFLFLQKYFMQSSMSSGVKG